MNAVELAAIVDRLRQQGTDDAYVEVKACASSLSSDVWESVSAFANTRGGTIIFGLDEKRGFTTVPGFALDKVRHQFVMGIGDGGPDNCLMVNAPQYELERVDFEGSQVLVVELGETDPRLKPCYIRRKGLANGAYKRIDDEDVKLSAAEIYELENALKPSLADQAVVLGATVADLDQVLVNDLILRKQRQGAKALKGVDDRVIQLTRLNVTNGDGDVLLAGLLALGEYPQQYYPRLVVDVAVHAGSRLNVTNGDGDVLLAGLLALGEYPQQYYPRLVVDVAVHAGSKKSIPGAARFLDRVICEGPLGEVVQESVRAVVKNLRICSVVRGTGREDVCEIPEEVLREAIANAVVHREYDSYFLGQSVSVDVYSDRVEIINPGGLWGGKTIDNLADGTSCCRNASLMKLMASVPLPDSGGFPAEGQGSGVALMIQEMKSRALEPPSFEAGVDFMKLMASVPLPDSGGFPAEGQGSGVALMIQEMKSRALEPPSFEAGVDFFKVILGRSGTELPENRLWIGNLPVSGLSQHEEAILLFVKQKGRANVHDIRDGLHFDSDDVRAMAQRLVKEGCLKSDGPDVYVLEDSPSSVAKSGRSVEETIIDALGRLEVASAQEIANAIGRPVSSVRYYLKKMGSLIVPTGSVHSPQRCYRLKKKD